MPNIIHVPRTEPATAAAEAFRLGCVAERMRELLRRVVDGYGGGYFAGDHDPDGLSDAVADARKYLEYEDMP